MQESCRFVTVSIALSFSTTFRLLCYLPTGCKVEYLLCLQWGWWAPSRAGVAGSTPSEALFGVRSLSPSPSLSLSLPLSLRSLGVSWATQSVPESNIGLICYCIHTYMQTDQLPPECKFSAHQPTLCWQALGSALAGHKLKPLNTGPRADLWYSSRSSPAGQGCRLQAETTSVQRGWSSHSVVTLHGMQHTEVCSQLDSICPLATLLF